MHGSNQYDGDRYIVDGAAEDRSAAVFQWGPPRREQAFGIVPHLGQEIAILTRSGVIQNADIYINTPGSWFQGATTSGGRAFPTISVYRLIAAGRHLLRRVVLSASTGGDPIVTPAAGSQASRIATDAYALYLLGARGLPCDGYEVTVAANQGGETLTGAGWGRDATAVLYTWGTETSTAPVGGSGPSGGGGSTTTTVELSGAPTDHQGTATTTPTQLPAAPLVQGLQLSNANGGSTPLFVGYSNSTVSQVLFPGDTMTIPVADASLVWVSTPSGSTVWLAGYYS